MWRGAQPGGLRHPGTAGRRCAGDLADPSRNRGIGNETPSDRPRTRRHCSATKPDIEDGLVLDPEAPLTPAQAAERLALRSLAYTGSRFPKDVRSNSQRALETHPDLMLHPALFTLTWFEPRQWGLIPWDTDPSNADATHHGRREHRPRGRKFAEYALAAGRLRIDAPIRSRPGARSIGSAAPADSCAGAFTARRSTPGRRYGPGRAASVPRCSCGPPGTGTTDRPARPEPGRPRAGTAGISAATTCCSTKAPTQAELSSCQRSSAPQLATSRAHTSSGRAGYCIRSARARPRGWGRLGPCPRLQRGRVWPPVSLRPPRTRPP
ncbi:DUF5954 family protein [Streptomyces shenzhenensis]|uniref:DUF5954 family protein n=1 Tax=Streptomyces shenzhenensis TaxID=943815 RepID=UPI001C7E59DB|nr:DUF5954 family protein [Streptomyces shenzhenensis]